MKLALASDVHLEFGDLLLKNTDNADVLILAGDIMIAEDLHDHPETSYAMYSSVDLSSLGRRQLAAVRYRDFLKRASFQFPHVIYVAGNHEFYNGRWSASLQHLRDECAKFPNIYFLERDTKVIDDVVFVGATLWTDCNGGDPLTLHSLSDMMNDYRSIRNDERGFTKLRPAHTMHRHQQSLAYFKTIVEQNRDQRVVVVGHHAPTPLSIHEHYKNDYLMNGAFSSDLSEFILDHPEIVLWCHGHTHYPFDYMMGSTRVVCNPRGYVGYEASADNFALKYFDV
jgi:predicted phosphodiesterase